MQRIKAGKFIYMAGADNPEMWHRKIQFRRGLQRSVIV